MKWMTHVMSWSFSDNDMGLTGARPKDTTINGKEIGDWKNARAGFCETNAFPSTFTQR